MNAAPFDTLRLAQALAADDLFAPRQAERLSQALAEAIAEETATRSDVDGARLALEGSIQNSEGRLRSAIETSKNDTLKWVVGMIGFQSLAILTAAMMLGRSLAR
jgi:hypothetical protein